MAQIPVQKREERGGFPWWIAAIAALALVAIVIGLTRRNDRADAVPDHLNDGTVSGPLTGSPVQLTGASTCREDSFCADGQLCVDGACTAITSSLAACETSNITFATGSAKLEEGQPDIDRAARCLKANRSMKVTLAGAADPRGTTATNDRLSEQRAHAVAQALTARGVSADQLHVVSYGEHQQLCAEKDEACWAKNRRTEVQLNH